MATKAHGSKLRIVSWNINKRKVDIDFQLANQSAHIILLQEANEKPNLGTEFLSLESDGMVIMWDSMAVKCTTHANNYWYESKKNKYIWLEFKIIKSQERIIVMGVHGNPKHGLDVEVPPIDTLKRCKSTTPWIILGDFNMTVNIEMERSLMSGAGEKKQVKSYRNFLQDPDIHEADFNAAYSYRDNLTPQGKSLVDRIVYNEPFKKLFSEISVTMIPGTLSDHLMMLLDAN